MSATVRNEVGADGAGDRSGIVEGDRVPSVAAIEGDTQVPSNRPFELDLASGVLPEVGTVADGVALIFDLRSSRVGVKEAFCFAFAIASSICRFTSTPELWVAMTEIEEVGIGDVGRGGMFESIAGSEHLGGCAIGEVLGAAGLLLRSGVS